LQAIAKQILDTHVMFATSETFKDVYVLELAYWNEGMGFKMFQKFLKKKNLPIISEPSSDLKIDRQVDGDIPELGDEGLEVLEKVGTYLTTTVDNCTDCRECAKACPSGAFRIQEGGVINIRTDLCEGANCRHCIQACSESVFKWENLVVAEAEK
jgi:ferredoxin